MHRPLRWIGRCGIWLLLLGLLLQILLRDRHPLWAPFFYALPPTLLAILSLGLVLFQGSRLRRFGLIALGLALLAWPGQKSNPQPHKPPTSPRIWSVLFWNLARPADLHQGALDLVRQRRPDFAAFVEPGEFAPLKLERYRQELPDYFVEWMPRGILWMSRALSRRGTRDRLAQQGAWASFRVEDDLGAFPVVVCDFRVNQGWDGMRPDQFQALASVLPSHPHLILLGDFNTPANSVHFDSWRQKGLQYGLAADGRPLATWPEPLPLLSLDQIWLGSSWQVEGVERLSAAVHSDHSALLIQLRR